MHKAKVFVLYKECTPRVPKRCFGLQLWVTSVRNGFADLLGSLWRRAHRLGTAGAPLELGLVLVQPSRRERGYSRAGCRIHGREPSSARQLISVNVCTRSSLGIEGPNAGKPTCVRSRDPSGFLSSRRLTDEGLGEAAEPSCTLSVSGTLSVLGVRRRAPPSCPEPDPPRAKLVFWFRPGVGRSPRRRRSRV